MVGMLVSMRRPWWVCWFGWVVKPHLKHRLRRTLGRHSSECWTGTLTSMMPSSRASRRTAGAAKASGAPHNCFSICLILALFGVKLSHLPPGLWGSWGRHSQPCGGVTREQARAPARPSCWAWLKTAGAARACGIHPQQMFEGKYLM
ncbi:hypothetical protein T484DRAFT_2964612 [Baffinella frigidus]|nr:hypothetical protein T484DRAFT_2964612 [Cryptophyta sp. CCMP2293]